MEVLKKLRFKGTMEKMVSRNQKITSQVNMEEIKEEQIEESVRNSEEGIEFDEDHRSIQIQKDTQEQQSLPEIIQDFDQPDNTIAQDQNKSHG